jgi:hypothetical protein
MLEQKNGVARVTQAARDAAASTQGPSVQAEYLRGRHDKNKLVQAFAALEVAVREECAGMLEAELELAFDGSDLTGFEHRNDFVRSMAQSIRSAPQAAPQGEGK